MCDLPSAEREEKKGKIQSVCGCGERERECLSGSRAGEKNREEMDLLHLPKSYWQEMGERRERKRKNCIFLSLTFSQNLIKKEFLSQVQ